MTREPLVTIATITAFVSALLTFLTAFGLDLTEEQTVAIMGIMTVLAPLLVALLVRPKVTPVKDPRLEAVNPPL